MEQTINYTRFKKLFSILAVIVFIWGVVGTLDFANIPFNGLVLSPDNVATIVREGSPVAQAGVKVGDTLIRIDTIPMQDLSTFANRPRPAINSAGSITVKRGEGEETLAYTYGQIPMTDLIAGFGAVTLTALAFLILGLMVYLKNPTRLSSSFCTLSLLFAAVLFNNPYFTSGFLRRLVAGISSFLVAIMFAAMLDYCLNFPRAKNLITAQSWLRQAIYLALGAFGIMVATIQITTPPITAKRALILSLASSLFFGGAMLLSIISVIHSYVKASSAERSATGLNLILIGMVIGFGPLLIAIIGRAINPQMGELPGERFYLISLLAIPIGLAMALMKLEPVAAQSLAEEPAT